MKSAKLAIGLLCAATLIGASQAEAKPGGCLKYGAAGAVAGHYAGHHAFKGALAGCVAGMIRRHEYNKHLREEKAQAAKQKELEHHQPATPNSSTPASANAPATNTPAPQTTTPATDQK